MKKTLLFLGAALLLSLLLLCACSDTEYPQEHIAETLYTGELNPIVEDLGVGLSDVKIDAPSSLTATVDRPTVTFSVAFSNVRASGTSAEGKPCTLKLIRDGAVIQEQNDFVLTDGATAEFSVEYVFERYLAQNDSHLIVELDYEDDYCFSAIPVTVCDYPDEYYAMTSFDPYPYSIDILLYENVAIVYGKDENGEYTRPVKVFICSTGVNTPERGTYKLLHKYEWKELIHGLWGQYATWVTGDILIHSLPYNSNQKDDMWGWQYNRLGGAVSTGCIRMRCCDTKWIFDYCPCGTPVTFRYATEMPDGLSYPTYEKLDLDSPYAGWDPTDPDPENPWKPEQPDNSWKALVPNYDELYTAYTTLDWKEYAAFVQSSDLFTAPETP